MADPTADLRQQLADHEADKDKRDTKCFVCPYLLRDRRVVVRLNHKYRPVKSNVPTEKLSCHGYVYEGGKNLTKRLSNKVTRPSHHKLPDFEQRQKGKTSSAITHHTPAF